MPLSRRQKSWDILDQSAIAFARQHKVPAHQVKDMIFSCFFFFEHKTVEICTANHLNQLECSLNYLIRR